MSSSLLLSRSRFRSSGRGRGFASKSLFDDGDFGFFEGFAETLCVLFTILQRKSGEILGSQFPLLLKKGKNEGKNPALITLCFLIHGSSSSSR